MTDPFTITPEIHSRWEAYAVAKMRAEDSLLIRDGVAAAQAFYAFVETFAEAGALGRNVTPLALYRRRRIELRGQRQ